MVNCPFIGHHIHPLGFAYCIQISTIHFLVGLSFILFRELTIYADIVIIFRFLFCKKYEQEVWFGKVVFM